MRRPHPFCRCTIMSEDCHDPAEQRGPGFTRLVTKLKAGQTVTIESEGGLRSAVQLHRDLSNAVAPKKLLATVIYARDDEERVILEHWIPK